MRKTGKGKELRNERMACRACSLNFVDKGSVTPALGSLKITLRQVKDQVSAIITGNPRGSQD